MPDEVRNHVEVLVDALARKSRGAPDHEVASDVDRACEEAFYAARAAGQGKMLSSAKQGHSLVAWTAIIAGRLRLRREEAGWTQAQLAAAMTRLGFDWKRITVAEAEGGGRRVSLEELLGLAILYGEPVVGLLLPDASEHLRFPPNRALEPAIVFELLLGSNGSLGHGGDDWAAARNAALVRPRDEDWRPAPMLWKRRGLGYGQSY